MLTMVEVAESHPDGYTEAVKKAVEGIINSGKKVHFFEVIEQRGAVREGKIKEFQVIVRVSFETS